MIKGSPILKRASEAAILYHKDCMDGLGSAFIAYKFFDYCQISSTFIPIQYGEDIIQILASNDVLHDECHVLFLDFSAPRDILLQIAEMVKTVEIVDHHKTAQKDLEGIEQEATNIKMLFDMNHSGVKLSYEYFLQHAQGKDDFLGFPDQTKKIFFDYIEDRDLWKWKMVESEAMSEYLRFKIIQNDICSFEDTILTTNPDDAIKMGRILVEARNKQVSKKIEKVKRVVICDIEFMMLNATENISEIGNAICKKYNVPALMYFITEQGEVVFSFRSMDELTDVSVIAKFFGGGGHRNACGAGKLSLNILGSVLNNEFANFKHSPIIKEQPSLFE